MTSAVTSMPSRLGPADDLDRAGGRDVADVQPRADVLGEHHVAGDDRLLGDRGPAGQAEPAGDLALVSAAAPIGQPRILRRAGRSRRRRPSRTPARGASAGVVHAAAVVAEHPHRGRGAGHARRVSASCSPARPTVTAPTGRTSTRPASLAEPPAPARRRSAVSATGSVLAIACTAVKPPSAAAAEPVAMVSASSRPGLAQVGVQVDEAGQQHQPVGVDDLGVGRRPSSLPIAAIAPSSIRTSVGSPPSGAARRVRIVASYSTTSSALRPRSWYSTAMRTATPAWSPGRATASASGRPPAAAADLQSAVHRAGVHARSTCSPSRSVDRARARSGVAYSRALGK